MRDVAWPGRLIKEDRRIRDLPQTLLDRRRLTDSSPVLLVGGLKTDVGMGGRGGSRRDVGTVRGVQQEPRGVADLDRYLLPAPERLVGRPLGLFQILELIIADLCLVVDALRLAQHVPKHGDGLCGERVMTVDRGSLREIVDLLACSHR